MAKIDLFENFEKNLSFEVTEDIYRAFQKCSSDMNPLHTNEDGKSQRSKKVTIETTIAAAKEKTPKARA